MTNRGLGAQSPALLAALVVVVVLGLGLIAMLVFNLGPFAPSGTSKPTFASGAPPSAQPSSASSEKPEPTDSATPTDGVSPSPTDGQPTPSLPTGTPSTSEEQLLAHVPVDIRPTCTTHVGRGRVELIAECSADEGAISLSYSQYEDTDSMDAAYEELRTAAGIEPSTGNCEDHSTWPADSSFNVQDETVGRRLCVDERGLPVIYWTDRRLDILSHAAQDPPDEERLLSFWADEAGPIP